MQTTTPIMIGALDLTVRPAIVAVLAGSEADCIHLAQQAHAEGADLLELRADLCGSGGRAATGEELARSIRQVREAVPLPVLLTVRHRAEGGRFSGDENERQERLLRLLPAVDAVDVELYAGVAIRERILQEAHAMGKPVVLSFHDFSHTPPRRSAGEGGHALEEIVEEGRALGADVVKIAARAETLDDLERLMRFTARCAARGVTLATMSMGNVGRISRVLNPFLGSCLTYGYVGEAATTPGQWAVRELRPALDLFPGQPVSEQALESAWEVVRAEALSQAANVAAPSAVEMADAFLSRVAGR